MPDYTGPRGLFREHEILRFVRQLPRDRTVLEIGAGKLSLTAELATRFKHVTALDLSPAIHEFARQLPVSVQDRLTPLHGDFLTMPIAETFDLVIACEVLEHVEQEEAFIRRVDTLLNPGGTLIISVPAHMRFWSRHDELVGHLRRYSRADLERVADWLPHDQVQIAAYGYPWINILRAFRVGLSGVMLKEQRTQTVEERTVASGQLHRRLSGLNRIVNRTTIAPFAAFSVRFNDTDRSDGYLLFVRKEPLAS